MVGTVPPQLANPKPSNFGLDNHFNAEIGKEEPLMVLGPGQDMFNHSIEAVGCLVDGKTMRVEGLELCVVARLIGNYNARGRCWENCQKTERTLPIIT